MSVFKQMEGGESLNPAITFHRRLDRSVDELIGISMGILSDGEIVRQEAEFLLQWLQKHREFASYYPFNVLYPRITAMLEDGILDPAEEGELMGLLLGLQGGTEQTSSSLPLCQPAPEIEFVERHFVVTGAFAIGSRKQVTAEIEGRGGMVKQSPSKKTHYLVIGDIGSDNWKHSSYGNKIEAAVGLRESGTGIRIVSEQHWLRFL